MRQGFTLATSVCAISQVAARDETDRSSVGPLIAKGDPVKKFFSANDQVLPRPVEALPEYASARARNPLAERLIAAFSMSEAAAQAIANAVVDPSTVRKYIGEPTDPQFEEIAVPGGHVLGIRTTVWSRRVMPDPRNPRTGPTWRHAFAVDPGMGDEDSRFRPLPETQTPEGQPETTPELVVKIESRHHLEWASDQAASYVLAENNWTASIETQGVMEAVWLVPTTFIHGDGADPVTALTTAEGSSRTTAVHNILGLRSSDVPYDDQDQKMMRTSFRRLTEALEKGTATPKQFVDLRCERMPALILVGFRRYAASKAGFPTAVKSLVALRHVDPPKPWGEGPANESLADEVLSELHRRKLITETERAYYAGAITKTEAKAAHLSDDPVFRATRIVELFAKADDSTGDAIRVAVTSQSTRKRITRKMCNELATALIVRSATEDTTKTDRIRRYMRSAFGPSVYGEDWKTTGKDVEALLKEAVREIERALGNPAISEPGPASLELAVRATYPLVVTGGLTDDRGTANNNQPDRRVLGEVIEGMRKSARGAFQLAQVLRDFAADRLIRAVDESGAVEMRPDGNGEQIISDVYLRLLFPPAGKVKATSSGTTPGEQLKARLAELSDAMDQLEDAFKRVGEIQGYDSTSLVDSTGVDPAFCETRRKSLREIGDELGFWERIYRKRHGSIPAPVQEDDMDDDDAYGDEEYEDSVEVEDRDEVPQ